MQHIAESTIGSEPERIPSGRAVRKDGNAMPKYVHVVAHLTPDELEQRYRKADDPVERSHLQIVWRLSRGKRVREVAEVTGYCANWIRIVARRYNQHGPAVEARSASAQQRCTIPAHR